MNKAGMKSLRGEAAGTPENAPGESADLRSVPAPDLRAAAGSHCGPSPAPRPGPGAPPASFGLLWAPVGGSSGLLRGAPQSSSSLFPAVLPPCGEVLDQRLSSLPSRILSFLLRAFWVSF